ncbi:MAG: DUF3750 domain-containing protein [Gammaproteobacteria bacterium]|nr:DUF3750 domain-containing protein [Gammaproteobacteria bacterium]MDE0227021.1 DUF3750 domain-containing protein [Gammaproteobacteria bacterium]
MTIWILFAVFVAPAVISIAWRASTGQTHWRDASHGSTGQAPDPAVMQSAIIQVYGARTWGPRGGAAVHTWITAKRANADEYERFEIIGWLLRRGESALSRRRGNPDAEWFSNRPVLLADVRGDDVDAVIDKLEAAIDAYPYKREYKTWPGPNSNTFTAFVARRVPELRLDLPPTAIGKDYLGNGGMFGKAPSGTGYQFSAFGLFGILAALEEGIEVNLGGLVAGIDFTSLAIKLPGLGTWPSWRRSEVWIGEKTPNVRVPRSYAATSPNSAKDQH